jgi:chemotaxis protein CheC
MTSLDPTLSELERDALTELVNIGVSRAAASLRKMVGEQVLLSVPSVEVVSHATALTLIGEREDDDLVGVRQEFSGAFSGRALLIFPRANSQVLVRAVLGDELAADEVAAMADEVLAETGNVILTGCLSTLANMLQRSLDMSLPVVLRGSGGQLFELRSAPGEDGVVLFLYINFWMHSRDIRGYIAMIMDLPSLAALRLLIGDFIARVLGDDVSQNA